MSSLFEHLCENNAVTHNPVKGVEYPVVESQQGKNPALDNAQARALLSVPDAAPHSRASARSLLSTLLYYGIRREELTSLMKDYNQTRQIYVYDHRKTGRRRAWRLR